MIPLIGLSAHVGLALVDATRDRQLEMIRDEPRHARAIEAFRERIADIDSAEKLVEDQELFAFVMRAFDLEDQIFGKAMIRRMLESDIDDPKALVNRLTDPRLREMYKELDFGPGGVGNTNTTKASWREAMVARFVERQFINTQAEQNETVGTVLEIRRKAASITGPFEILRDAGTFQFFRRALGLPDAMAQIDIDRQAAILTEKLDFDDLKDPAKLDRLIRRYVAITEALDGSAAANNAAVQLMSSAVSVAAGGQFVPVTLDITAITASPAAAYR